MIYRLVVPLVSFLCLLPTIIMCILLDLLRSTIWVYYCDHRIMVMLYLCIYMYNIIPSDQLAICVHNVQKSLLLYRLYVYITLIETKTSR